jgi:hypothetical protein
VEHWELVAREAIRETMGRYAHAADSGRFDDLVALFAPDGVLEVHGEPPLAGREAIRAFLTSAGDSLAGAATVPMIRHNVTSITIDVVNHDEARGDSYFLAITEHGVDHWGRYRDAFARNGDQWLFAHRRVRTDGTTPGGWAAGRVADEL